MQSANRIQESGQYQTIYDYLTTQNASLDDYIEAFAAPVEQQITTAEDESQMEAALWQCWQAVTHLAAQTPHSSPGRRRLVDFVLHLQQRPDVLQNNQPCKVWDAVVWRDLPVFGAQMRESWNFANTPEPKQLNLNAFAATLLHKAHQAPPPQPQSPLPDLSLHALWTLRAALEESPEPSPPWLKSAALWLIHAAPTLRALSAEGRIFQGKLARASDGVRERFPEWRGFSMERWEFWKGEMRGQRKRVVERLRSGSGGGGAGDEVVEFAERAVEAMQGAGR